jgi:RND family efflux transporter MFP subunit
MKCDSEFHVHRSVGFRSGITASGFVPGMLSAACILLVFAGCSEQQETADPPAAAVRTFVLGAGISDPFRRFPGEVSALQTSEMSFDVSGRMIERPATQGAIVEKGGLLARLDPENFQTDVDSARSRFTNAREELSRQTQLRDRGVISVAELDRFRTEFEVAEASLRQAERALQDTRMVAPFDGRVARTIVNNFASVRANEPILIFQNIAGLEVDIDVPERLMTQGEQHITAEQAREKIEAKVEFPALSGRQFPLSLKSFRTAAESSSRTFRVTFLLAPPDGFSILPGMTCTVLLRRTGAQESVTEESVFEVPVTAVGTLDNQTVVWRLDPDTMTAQPQVVELEGLLGESIRVRSEVLSPGEEIITTGVRMLFPGRVVSRLAPAPR